VVSDKNVNWAAAGVILAMIVQAGTLIWWGGGLSARVAALEARTAPLSDGTLARLDERTASISKSLERLERREEVRP
jgi:hypothetical protein